MPLDDKVNVSILKSPTQIIIIIKHTKNKELYFSTPTDKEQYYAKNTYNYRRLKKNYRMVLLSIYLLHCT